jgi:FtsZ-binding cell division protein ZapB
MNQKIVAKNLGGVVVSGKFLDGLCKITIADNQYLDEESRQILCRHVDDLRSTIQGLDDLVVVLKDNIEALKQKNESLEKRVNELQQLCRCYRQEEQAYYGQHR